MLSFNKGITLVQKFLHSTFYSPVDCRHRIYQLRLCKGVITSLSSALGMTLNQNGGEAQALEIREMWITPSLPLLQGPH